MEQNEAELRILNVQAQTIAEQLDKIDSAIMEIEYLKQSIADLSSIRENNEILSPISNGIFVKAKIGNAKKLLINVGNGVVVEKTSEETKSLLDERIDEISKSRENLLGQLKKIEEKLEEMEQCSDS